MQPEPGEFCPRRRPRRKPSDERAHTSVFVGTVQGLSERWRWNGSDPAPPRLDPVLRPRDAARRSGAQSAEPQHAVAVARRAAARPRRLGCLRGCRRCAAVRRIPSTSRLGRRSMVAAGRCGRMRREGPRGSRAARPAARVGARVRARQVARRSSRRRRRNSEPDGHRSATADRRSTNSAAGRGRCGNPTTGVA